MKEAHRLVPDRKPAPKEHGKNSKKSLKEFAGSLLSVMIDKAREDRMKVARRNQKEQEDLVAEMTFGPNWRSEEPTTRLSLVPDFDLEPAE